MIETVATIINGILIHFPLFIVCTVGENRLLGMNLVQSLANHTV